MVMKILNERVIYLAGGCFWGVEAYFQQLKGVLDTEVGYANGDSENPSYEDLVAHRAIPRRGDYGISGRRRRGAQGPRR